MSRVFIPYCAWRFTENMKYSGPFFNKAMNLYRKIIGDTQFVNEIKYLDQNSESLNSESDVDLEGVDEESVDFKE